MGRSSASGLLAWPLRYSNSNAGHARPGVVMLIVVAPHLLAAETNRTGEAEKAQVRPSYPVPYLLYRHPGVCLPYGPAAVSGGGRTERAKTPGCTGAAFFHRAGHLGTNWKPLGLRPSSTTAYPGEPHPAPLPRRQHHSAGIQRAHRFRTTLSIGRSGSHPALRSGASPHHCLVPFRVGAGRRGICPS